MKIEHIYYFSIMNYYLILYFDNNIMTYSLLFNYILPII